MSRGRLRVYLGAAPGVGKTYAMLGEGHRRKERGTDVVVGFVEAHGRVHTEDLIGGLEVIPRKQMEYRESIFTEMDVDAILRRTPAVALVDEMAHTNVPGSPNEKRWQDINVLLDGGIDVITTVNIQHLESLNDTVEAITGIKQQETVPDAVVRAADQVELVDMSPEALRRRLAHGNVYRPDKIDTALGNYFRVGNLAALRELALLWLADRVEEGLEHYRNEHEINATWPARQRIVVALTGGPEGCTLLRRGAVVAGRSAGRDLLAVHVVRSDGARGVQTDALTKQRRLTEELGGTFHTVVGDDVPTALLEFTRSVNGTRIVVGESRRGRMSTALRPSTANLVVRDSVDIDVQVVTHERAAGSLLGSRTKRDLPGRRKALAWIAAFALPILVTLLLLPFERADNSLDITLVLLAMLVSVVGCSLMGGIAAALASSLFAMVLTNWFFIPPTGSFTIAEPKNLIAIVMFVLVGCTIAVIVDRSSALAEEAALGRAESEALNTLAVGVLQRPNNLVHALLELACSTFGMRTAVLFEESPDDGKNRTVEAVGEGAPTRPDRADVAVDAGPGLTLAASGRPLTNSERRILTAYASQAASLLERDRLAARAADVTRLREAENARRALLAAVSHDLRTPIAGVKASISTLADEQLELDADDRQSLLEAAERGTDRLSSLVDNLLDMNRLQTGAVRALPRRVVLDEIIQRAITGFPLDTVVSDIGEDLPVIETDPTLLERILANIIENAARQYSHGEPVHVMAGFIAAPVPHIDIRVMDQGPGVRPELRAAMFQPFQQPGDQKQASAGGTGLGLAVAAGLARLIGAVIEAEDTPGTGLTMVVSVPLALPTERGSE